MSLVAQGGKDPKPPQFFAYSAMPFPTDDDESSRSTSPSPDHATDNIPNLGYLTELLLDCLKRLENLERGTCKYEQRIVDLEDASATLPPDTNQDSHKLQNLASDNDAHQRAITSLEGHVQRLEESIATVHSTISKTSDRHNNTLKEAETRLFADVESIISIRLKATNDKLSSNQKEVDTLMNLQDALKKESIQLSEKVAQTDVMLESLKTWSSTVSELTSHVLTLQAQYSELDRTVDGLHDQVRDVSSEYPQMTLQDELQGLPDSPAVFTDSIGEDLVKESDYACHHAHHPTTIKHFAIVSLWMISWTTRLRRLNSTPLS
ncbi:hypothetical protein CONPUDRAFT_150560 [Coniophora puteana RWD-64-598 SS2]|uniref:Uncharacterized protein n=1 Tax=Coniophora puteana (strain RWD-64-598) TaxID=741705 RepID=A0A5M3N3B2_CONPW|nr:uncharacterized protein CONPUDRAFT_150560 [Coniophora puteana RWD-64-598 SS2]EIW85777.1 hypothetical protein CONPUDRAFT_150560 [Coniophora puteana RWD-64-598 SS2]